MGANEVVPSDAVTPADSYNARRPQRLEFIEENISSILAECLKKSGVEHSIPVVRSRCTGRALAQAGTALRRASSVPPEPPPPPHRR